MNKYERIQHLINQLQLDFAAREEAFKVYNPKAGLYVQSALEAAIKARDTLETTYSELAFEVFPLLYTDAQFKQDFESLLGKYFITSKKDKYFELNNRLQVSKSFVACKACEYLVQLDEFSTCKIKCPLTPESDYGWHSKHKAHGCSKGKQIRTEGKE